MSGLSSSGRRGSLEPSGSWASGLGRRGSRDRTQSVDIDGRPAGDGPVFEEGVIKRPAGTRTGRVFGRELVEVGRAWGISRDIEADLGDSEYQKRRRACLPALVVRAVEYRESLSSDLADDQWRYGVQKKRAYFVSAAGLLIYRNYGRSLTLARI